MNATDNSAIARRLITINPPQVGTVNLSANLRQWQKSPGKPSLAPHFRDLAYMLPTVHGTSIERFEGIINSGVLKSFGCLSSEGHAVSDQRLLNATDSLDIALGLHDYVFFNIGRVNPIDLQEVYLCFPGELSCAFGALAGLREIVHFGGLVSVEAAEFFIAATNKPSLNIAKRNLEAAHKFFAQLYTGKDFISQVFPTFLQKHFSEMKNYLLRIEFPGTDLRWLRHRNEMTLRNAWEGPQLMVPGSVTLADHAPLVLVTSYDTEVQERVKLSGFPPARIYQMADVLPFDAIDGRSVAEKMVNLAICVNQALANLMPLISPERDYSGLDFLKDGFWSGT